MKSDVVKKGPTRCAHRSLFYALGFGPEELEKPLIGICNSFNEVIPGHMHLREITEAAKLAKAANVKELWLTHFSPSLLKAEEFMPDVRRIFPNAFAGKDGKTSELVFEED